MRFPVSGAGNLVMGHKAPRISFPSGNDVPGRPARPYFEVHNRAGKRGPQGLGKNRDGTGRVNKIRRNIFDIILDSLTFIAGIIILAITFTVSGSALMRYLGFRPPLWTFQFTEYALLWFTFLAAAWLLREGGHISIDTVVSLFHTGTRRKVEIMDHILGFIVSVTIFVFGTLHTIDLFQREIMEVKGTTVPKFPLFLIIPLGGLALSIQFGRQFFKDLRSKPGNAEN